MIEINGIEKSFGGKVVLNDVSAVMQGGKVNLVIGTSGSGKTVFMKCIIGLIRPEYGEIIYEGKSFLTMDSQDRKELRTKIGMLFQGSALFDSMNVESNVQFPLDMFTNETKKEKQKRVDEVLEKVNLNGANNKFPAEISGGMKKRVALARAIVMNPKYLFCDEPNSGLDPKTSLVIDKLIMDLTQEYNMTTVINTHDMNTVIESGDHIIYLHQGEKEWEGTKEQIIFSEHERLNEFIFASDFLRDAKEQRMRSQRP